MNVGIIGYGNMGSSIAKGLYDVYDLVIYNRTVEKIDLNVNIVTTMQEVIDMCDVVFLCVKPHLYEQVLLSLDIKDTTIISIGAGITSDFMSKICCDFVLTMPNTSAMNKGSITSVVKSNTKNYNIVLEICKNFGDVIEIEEFELPSYTVLFGSSPAFFFYFVECFSRQFNVDSSLIAKHFIATSAMLLTEEASILCDNVCSEGGVTIEGINSLKANDLENIIQESINVSIQRYEQMQLK